MQDAHPATQERIFPIVMGFWQARALSLATELGVILASGFPSLQVSSLLEMPVWEELPGE